MSCTPTVVGDRAAQLVVLRVGAGRVALSSAEAEVFANVEVGREGRGARQLLHDLRWEHLLIEFRRLLVAPLPGRRPVL